MDCGVRTAVTQMHQLSLFSQGRHDAWSRLMEDLKGRSSTPPCPSNSMSFRAWNFGKSLTFSLATYLGWYLAKEATGLPNPQEPPWQAATPSRLLARATRTRAKKVIHAPCTEMSASSPGPAVISQLFPLRFSRCIFASSVRPLRFRVLILLTSSHVTKSESHSLAI